MSGALAYDLFDETQYSDAQKIVLEPNVPSKRPEETEDVSPGEDVEPKVKEASVFVLPVNKLSSKEQKPHLIALDYIAHRYNLRYQGESLRKRLAITKNPDRLNKSIEKDLFKSLKLALSIGK